MSKDTILQSALYLFSRKGYEGTSLSELADRSGMRKASIYSHFKNKEAVFWAVIDRAFEEETEKLSSLLTETAEESFQERLNRIIDLHVDFYKQNDEKANLWRRMTLFPPEAFQDRLQNKLMEYEQQCNALLEQEMNRAIKAGEIAAIDANTGIAMVLCMVDGLFMEYSYYTEEEFDKRVQAVKQMTWRAFMPVQR
ncbi:TetR/AcrR family transcriptional regulator [Pontibacillus yanchengensis]|uniref:TetR/AcrR family transcriptional regulator n=1 Tax=Pontibacillus yanchengensis TaxID=462910 RepID=UPI001369C727|nr:TetR/AcrR family transcriptional regulator [Pontibacillus yanchengensis]